MFKSSKEFALKWDADSLKLSLWKRDHSESVLQLTEVKRHLEK